MSLFKKFQVDISNTAREASSQRFVSLSLRAREHARIRACDVQRVIKLHLSNFWLTKPYFRHKNSKFGHIPAEKYKKHVIPIVRALARAHVHAHEWILV